MVEIPKSIDQLPVSEPRWVGKPMKRVESPLLVTGRAQMQDDIELPGMVHCAILHSPHPHARIVSIDLSEARKLPGVFAVIASEDAQRLSKPGALSALCMALDMVRYVGEEVAAVAAVSRQVAEDALDLIKVEYELLPTEVDAKKAMEPGATVIFDYLGTNVVWERKFNWGDVDAAFAEADHVVTREFRWNRMSGNPMETFGVISQWDPIEDAVTLYGGIHMPMLQRQFASMMLGLPTHKIRMIAQWMGANFGAKGAGRATEIVSLLSRALGGRPVKYIQDRVEYLVSGVHCWDRHFEASLAVKKNGVVTGLKVKLLDNGGAMPMGGISAIAVVKPLSCFTGCYTIPSASYDCTIVATNKCPVGTIRGVGPPAHYVVLEGLMDTAARELGIDPAEIRRRNFIPPDKFPYTIPSGNEYDSGNYEATLQALLKMADYPKLRREQEEARKQGRYLGIGIATTVEPGGFNWNVVGLAGFMVSTNVRPEGVRLSVDPFGKIVAKVSFSPEGQGQYTFVTQILADYFAVEPGDIRVIMDDTQSALIGTGPGGSSLAVYLSAAVLGAAQLLTEKLSKVAAKAMEANPEDIEFKDGKFRVKGGGTEMPIGEVVGVMTSRLDLLPPGVDPNPEASFVYTTPGRDMPDEQGRCKSYITAANAAHLVVVEVDPETAEVKVLKYYVADDCGTRLNPANVDGQIQGSVVMGLGVALLEECVYSEDAQPLATTLMDYPLPTIHEAPVGDRVQKMALCTPSPFTALGAKGTGEGAMHTTPAAIINAINDALVPLGVAVSETPASPNRLWKLIQQVKKK